MSSVKAALLPHLGACVCCLSSWSQVCCADAIDVPKLLSKVVLLRILVNSTERTFKCDDWLLEETEEVLKCNKV